MAVSKKSLRQKLLAAGFLPSEINVLVKGYTPSQFRTISYLKKIVKARRLYVARLRSLGDSEELIQQKIKKLYVKNKWLYDDGDRDVWKMIRRYRQRDIDAGEYFPTKKKGSHHGQGVSTRDLGGQRTRLGKTSVENRIANLNAQIERASDPDLKQWLIGLRNRLGKGK